MPSTQIFQQKRETIAGTVRALAEGAETDLHQEVKISDSTDGLSAEAAIYNIAHSTWKDVQKDDPFRISLGYVNGPFKPCVYGIVQEKLQPERYGADYKYAFKGRDKSGATLRQTYESHTWNKPTIRQVAQDMAGFCSLGLGKITTPGITLKRRWPIMDEHNIRYWLDELVKEANESGTQYHAYAQAGKLYFKPKSTGTTQAITLTDGKGGNVIHIDETQGKDKKTGGGDSVKFEALLDPRIRRDGLVSVDTEDYSGAYRVHEYTITSSTESGDHTMKGTIAPTSAKYVSLPNTTTYATVGKS